MTAESMTAVTLELLQAVASAQEALRARTREVIHAPEYTGHNMTGRLLREGVERDLQKADLLRGWCERQRIAQRIPEEDIRYV